MRQNSEAQLQVMVADYLRLQYPSVLFHSDYGSGVKLTMSQAVMQKRQNGGRRSWPDLFIAKPRWYQPEDATMALAKKACGDDSVEFMYWVFKDCYRHGLFIELKKEGTRIFKKDGTLVADEHIREQFDLLDDLRCEGYEAKFACGFDEAKRIIDNYMKGIRDEEDD